MRKIRAGADAVRLERGGTDSLVPVRVHVADSADRAVTIEQTMEVLVSFSQPGVSCRRGRLRNGVELQQEVLHELLDRGRGGRCLVALKTC